MTLRVLDLFSGIGGFSLGLERAGMCTVAFCEIDPYCQAIIKKHWPEVPCHGDIRTFRAPAADVVCGGFPCQNISSSGDKTGIQGELSGLWFEFARIIRELRPRYVIVENVSDLLSRGLGEVLGSLVSIGYDAEWHCIPACFVGMPQARERVWIIAYPDGRRCGRGKKLHQQGPILECRADDDRLALAQHRAREARSWVRRADDGLPNRLERVRALGNSIVPQIAEMIGRAILKHNGEQHV